MSPRVDAPGLIHRTMVHPDNDVLFRRPAGETVRGSSLRSSATSEHVASNDIPMTLQGIDASLGKGFTNRAADSRPDLVRRLFDEIFGRAPDRDVAGSVADHLSPADRTLRRGRFRCRHQHL